MLMRYGFTFLVCLGFFSLLAQIYPNIKHQRVLRKGFITDIFYWFLTPLIYVQIAQWVLLALSYFFFLGVIETKQFLGHGFSLFVGLPILVQFFISILLMNIAEYWMHRLFHGKTLWKIHSIHHSAKELDWLSGVRLHPVNMLMHSIFSGSIVFAFGFSKQQIAHRTNHYRAGFNAQRFCFI